MKCIAWFCAASCAVIPMLSVTAETCPAGDPIVETVYFKSVDTSTDDRFGVSVAIDGEVAVVGAKDEDSISGHVDSGAAYIFELAGGVWSYVATLKPSDLAFTQSNGWFGAAVAIEGDTIVVGSPFEATSAGNVTGAAYVYTHNGSTWSTGERLVPDNVDPDDRFGASVAVEDGVVVVGAPREDGGVGGVATMDQTDNSASQSGAIYVYQNSGSSWGMTHYIKRDSPGSLDRFGRSVSIDSGRIAVGAPFDNGSVNNSGAVILFEPGMSSWAQSVVIKANDPDDDEFGASCSLSGSRLAVGAPREDGGGAGVGGDPLDDSVMDSGAAYVFVYDQGVWSQEVYLKALDSNQFDLFGYGVAICGDYVLAATPGDDSLSSGVWGDYLDNSGPDTQPVGAAHLFVRESDQWCIEGYLKASNADTDDRFSSPVGVSLQVGNPALDCFDGMVLIGAHGEGSDAMGVGGDPDNESLGFAGAAYLYELGDYQEPGAAFCYGDGLDGVSCPCANNSAHAAGAGCLNSLGMGGRLSSSGSASTVADDLVLSIEQGRPGNPALFIQGATVIKTPFKDGKLCLGVPTERLEVATLDGAGASQSVESIVANGNIAGPGLLRYYQAWYRDPMTSPCGEGSNFTNGIIICWY